MKFRNKKTGEVVEWGCVAINSSLVSAQNRERYYWSNLKIDQPKDMGIVLKDILEFGHVCINYSSSGRGNGKVEGRAYESTKKKAHTLTKAGYSNRSLTGVVLSVNDNDRVFGINENDRGFRPHRGDRKSTGISELGRIIKPSGKTDSITASHAPKVALNLDINDIKYRKLTPVECERLQTVPDNYTAGVSNSQRYKMLGNGWTVDVIAHIFKGLK